MRAGEIFKLTWDKVYLTKRIIKLEAEDTKTCESRVVFLCHRAYDIWKPAGRVRFLEPNRVFTYKGAPLKKVKKAFANAGRKAEINNFRFYDLRHTFITNMRKAGVDHSVIMKLTGHKTPSRFQRYNTVALDDAQGAWQTREELFSKDQERGANWVEMCSLGAPEGGNCRT